MAQWLRIPLQETGVLSPWPGKIPPAAEQARASPLLSLRSRAQELQLLKLQSSRACALHQEKPPQGGKPAHRT